MLNLQSTWVIFPCQGYLHRSNDGSQGRNPLQAFLVTSSECAKQVAFWGIIGELWHAAASLGRFMIMNVH